MVRLLGESGPIYRRGRINFDRRGALPAFTPASIFTGTDTGFWAPVTTSRLWQDVARTTPVTAAGQSVASWELTTRTGVIYAEQATAGSRPTYQLDGLAGYLDFNGNRWMVTPTITPASDKLQFFGGIRQPGSTVPSDSAAIVMESSLITDSNNGSFFVVSRAAAAQGRMWFRTRGTVISDTQTGLILNNTDKNIWTMLGDIAADSAIIRANGVEVLSNTASDQGTGGYLAYPVYIGARGGTSLFWNGRLYGAIVRFGPSLTAGQITSAEGWMNSVLNP